MLTKDDLAAIRKITREEVTTESQSFRRDLQGEMKLFRMRIEERLYDIEDKLKDLDISSTKTESAMLKLTKEVKRVKKEIKSMIAMFDTTDMKLRKRVERIEEKLNIPSAA